MLWDKNRTAKLNSAEDIKGEIKNPFMSENEMQSVFKGRVKPTAAFSAVYKGETNLSLAEIMARLK